MLRNLPDTTRRLMVILLVWVLPIFNQVYAQLGSRLTGIAGGLLAFGVVLRQILPYLCGLLAICLIVGVIPFFTKYSLTT